MSRFRIHRSLEEELAKKADEFSMQPSLAAWQGVEKGLAKTRTVQTYWKVGIRSLSLLAVIGILLVQDKQSRRPEIPETGIRLASPLSEGTASLHSGAKPDLNFPGTDFHGEAAKRKNISPVNLVLEEKSGLMEQVTTKADPSNLLTPKIVLKNIKPKPLGIEVNMSATDYASCQNRKHPSELRRRDGWYFQLNFTPAYAYRNISARTDYARPLEERKKELDKGISGYSARIQARYHFSNRFSLAFGVGISRSGERIGMAPKKNSPVYTALAEEYDYESEEMNSLGNLSYYSNRYNYIELPLTLYSKKQLSPRLSLTTGLGLSLGYMVSYQARCYDYRVDHYVNNPKFYNDWTVGTHAQLLLEYSLNTRWALSAGPEFNYALLSTYRNYYTLSQHQFSVGMNFGVQWKLFDITKSRLGE